MHRTLYIAHITLCLCGNWYSNKDEVEKMLLEYHILFDVGHSTDIDRLGRVRVYFEGFS